MIVRIFFEFFEENQKMSSNLMRTGAVGGIRTRDLSLTKGVLYRLSHNSETGTTRRNRTSASSC